MELKEHIEIELARSWRGFSVRIKTTPEVEEFVKSFGTGEAYDVRMYGRHWKPQGGGMKDFNVYHLDSNRDPGIMVTPDGGLFDISHPGFPLLTSNNGSKQTLNMSFLRLVGSSQGSGVTFTMKDVCNLDILNDLKNRITLASEAFYTRYLKPVNFTVTICTQEQ